MRTARPARRSRLAYAPRLTAASACAALALYGVGCSSASPDDGVLTIYAGRGQDLVEQVIADFVADTGIRVEVHYAATDDLVAELLTEGTTSPADVFWSQDAGSLDIVEAAGLLDVLPQDVQSLVDARYRATDGTWVGVTGRVRSLVWSTERMTEQELPASVLDLTGAAWRGRVGWAPTNASFQAFITAMRVTLGEDATRAWLEAMAENNAHVYDSNAALVDAVGRGEIDVGLVNHYFLLRVLEQDPEFPAANAFLPGDLGSFVNVSGIGHLAAAGDRDLAARFITFLLSDDVQSYLANVVDEEEYPLVAGVAAAEGLPPLASLGTPDVDLSALSDIGGTIAMLQAVGVL